MKVTDERWDNYHKELDSKDIQTVNGIIRKTMATELVKRFPFIRGGSTAFRKQGAVQKLAFIRGIAKKTFPVFGDF